MKMRYFEPEKDGFYGVWYPNEENTDCGLKQECQHFLLFPKRKHALC